MEAMLVVNSAAVRDGLLVVCLVVLWALRKVGGSAESWVSLMDLKRVGTLADMLVG